MARTYILDVKILADNIDPYATEPVTVAELKTYLQLEGTAYDGPLAIFIKAARKKVENYCNASLVPKSILASFDVHGISGMPLPFPPVAAITKVEWKYCPSNWRDMVLDDDYHLDSLDGIQSSECGKHRVTYTTEPPEDMALYQQAVMAQAGYMYTHRDDSKGWAPEAEMLLEESRNINF